MKVVRTKEWSAGRAQWEGCLHTHFKPVRICCLGSSVLCRGRHTTHPQQQSDLFNLGVLQPSRSLVLVLKDVEHSELLRQRLTDANKA